MVRFVPDAVATERPWRPDTDKPIFFRMSEHDSYIEKQQSKCWQQRTAHLKRMTKISSNRQSV